MLQPSPRRSLPATSRTSRSVPTAPRTSKVPAPIRWVGNTLAFIILSIALFAAAIMIVIPVATGSQTYAVLTGSMAPGYPPGTLIVVKPHDFDDLKAGDVVTYQLESGQNTVVTHRIVGFSAAQNGDRLLITQGDANNVADELPVMEVQVRGKLSYAVPYAGYLANALGHSDRAALVELLAVGLIIYGAVAAVRGLVQDRQRPARSLREPSE